MRVLVAPDGFAGTLSAVEAARAVAAGWRRHAPGDDLVQLPMADGGSGFVDVLHAALGGQLLAVTVSGPLGRPVPATVLLAGTTAYVESAQACGLALLPRAGSGPEPGIAERASTLGVGELVAAAVAAGATRVVVGLGGSGTTDGGAGLLAGLGAAAAPADALRRGALGLTSLDELDLAPARDRIAGVELVAATDVDNPLLGLRGATNVYGPQKGLDAERVLAVDGALTRLAYLAGRELADARGAGAAGGLGYGLLLLGASVQPGFDVVAQTVGLASHVDACDLVVTGEGRLDHTSLRGKVVAGVARHANAAGVPCIALAGDAQVGSRELRAGGVEAGYGMVQLLGREPALDRPAEALAQLAARVARTWSRSRT
jgi:glycerate kinase